MSHLGRLVDAGISLVEGLIERFADPERLHFLEEALWRSDDRLAEAYKDVSESEDRYDRLLREIGCALGVEDEGESAIIAAAWEAAGRKEGLLSLERDSLELRSFAVSEDLDALLVSRAAAENVPKSELVRRFVDLFLMLPPSAIHLDETDETRVLRRYHLDSAKVRSLDRLCESLSVSRGQLFRAALLHGLAVGDQAVDTEVSRKPVYSAVIEANRRANREVKRTLTVTAHDLPGFTCKCPECNGDTDGNQ